MSSYEKKPRSGGPRTNQGKAKSSLNALNHGLTSSRVMPDEVKMVDEFIQELTSYYKPESPLEVLQIQRIAFCRAKLAKLIDIEIAGREMARREIENTPSLVISRLKQYDFDVREVAMEVIAGILPLARFGLDRTLLAELDQEIKDFLGVVNNEDDLCQAYPKLSRFLFSLNLIDDDLQEAGVERRLYFLSQKIRNWKADQNSTKLNKSSNEVDRILLAIMRDDDLAERAKHLNARPYMTDGVEYHQAIDKDLQEIRSLSVIMDQVDQVVRDFHDMKSWMLRSIDLNSQDSERMMKYQGMLERRLSNSIGELLELRNHKNRI